MLNAFTIEDVIGQSIYGYRAPSWSIIEDSLWALDILEELGFMYTSSIFPTQNYLYGIPYAPRFKHDCRVYKKENLKLINVPPSTIQVLGKNIPFSGGAYFRLFPAWMIHLFSDKINKKEQQSVIFYLHPREIDPKQPKLDLRFKDWMIHYYGIKSCKKKLNKVLGKTEFITMRQFLGY